MPRDREGSSSCYTCRCRKAPSDGLVEVQWPPHDELAAKARRDRNVILVLGGAPVSIEQGTLPLPNEQRMTGDQSILLEDLDLVGHAVYLDHAAACGVRD